jgi:hypothetical protein
MRIWEKDAKTGRTVAGNQTRGSALNEFGYPSRVVLDSNRSIIVADTQNERITKWPSVSKYDPKTSIGTLMAVGCSFLLNEGKAVLELIAYFRVVMVRVLIPIN